MATNRVTNVSLQVLLTTTLASTSVRVSNVSMQVLRSTADAPAGSQGAVTTTIVQS